MDKENIVELTNKLYKLTLLFPKKEPLRYKIRELADEILAGIVREGQGQERDRGGTVPQEFEVLDSYFEVAKWQNWVSYFDVLEIQEDYAKIKNSLKTKDLEEEKSLKIEFPKPSKLIEIGRGQSSSFNLDERKEKILEILKEMGRVQVYQVKEIFPELSKRTLRRDFEKLLKQGLVERSGERNETFYQLPIKNR